MLAKEAGGKQMADRKHLDILKQGVEAWNQWRRQHPNIKPDLRGAKLYGANLTSADLSYAHVSPANLDDTDLRRANLTGTLLWSTHLEGANLEGASLRDTDLRRADLHRANLSDTDLSGADLSFAKIVNTIFGNVDLQSVKGLKTVEHIGPSHISTSTLVRSKGNIPETFLRGAGLDDTFIAYIRSPIGKAIEYYSCFISYSSRDEAFAKQLHADLQSNNVRCWFAPEDMKIGDKIRSRIDEAIRIHDKLLLVLSENSVESAWVEKEVETAFDRENQHRKLVLFPVRLDDTVMHTTQAWAADIRRTRHIGDFRNWENHNHYQKALTRLLRDLKAEP